MKKNLGKTDRIIRSIIAVVLFDLAARKTMTGFWDILLFVLAIILLVTAFVGLCPLYAIFGIKSCSDKKITNLYELFFFLVHNKKKNVSS
jgi:hypothetical protein